MDFCNEFESTASFSFNQPLFIIFIEYLFIFSCIWKINSGFTMDMRKKSSNNTPTPATRLLFYRITIYISWILVLVCCVPANPIAFANYALLIHRFAHILGVAISILTFKNIINKIYSRSQYHFDVSSVSECRISNVLIAKNKKWKHKITHES